MKPCEAILILGAALGLGTASVRAQEFTVFACGLNAPKTGDDYAAWQLDYRQNLGRHAAWSLAWLNEGHVPNHHRDGPAAQVWGVLPGASEKFAFSVGAGVYRYFDTQLAEGGDSLNVHGWAPLFSIAATYYTRSSWLFQVRANRASPRDNIEVDTVNFGVGYAFESPRLARVAPGSSGLSERTTENELTVFGGQTVVNTRLTGDGVAWSVEYRRGVSRHLDWSAAWLDEGHPDVVRRSGVATEFWLAGAFLEERLALSFGVGAYAYMDHHRPKREAQGALAGLFSLSAAHRFSDSWGMRFTWHRVSNAYDRDSDVFLVGLGYRWGL